MSQEINNLFIKSKPVTEEERKSALKLKVFENLKKHLDISDEALNNTENVREFLQTKIINYLNEGNKIKTKALKMDFMMLGIQEPNLDGGQFNVEAIMKIIDSKAKFNRGEVDIKLEDAHQILKVDKEKLKAFCSLCFTEEKEVYIEKFKQELLVKGFPIALIKILDLDLTYEPIKDMTYGQVESGYETRLESLKEQLFSSAQQRLNYTYTSSGMTTITDEEVLSYQMLRQSGMLTDEMIAKIISRMHRTLMNNNKVWMALHLGIVREMGLDDRCVNILENGPISTDDLGVDIEGHSIIWWAVNYNDQEMVEKIKRLFKGEINYLKLKCLFKDANKLKVIKEVLECNIIQEIPEKLKLDFAIKYGQVEVAKKLIRSWDMAKLVQKNNFGQTPMHLAIKHGRPDLAELLIGKLSKKQLNEEKFLLHMVLKNVGMQKVAGQLIEKLDNDKLVQKYQLGLTPLHLAIEYGRVKIAKKLIQSLDVDKLVQKNDSGQTPIHLAIKHKQHDVLKELMNSINPIGVDNLQFHIRFCEIIEYLQSDAKKIQGTDKPELDALSQQPDVSELESNQKDFDDAIGKHQSRLFCQINLDMGKNDSRETHLKNIKRSIASLPSRTRKQINDTLVQISKLKQLETKLMSHSLRSRSRHKDNINKLDKIEILLGNVKKLYDLQTKNGLIILSEKLGLDGVENNTGEFKAEVQNIVNSLSEEDYSDYSMKLGPTRGM